MLTSRPLGNVVITVDNPDTGAVTVDTSAIADIQTTLTFTRDNWSTPQSVTVTPVDDADARNESVVIEHDITTGSGTDYLTRLSIDDVTVTVDDDDTASVTITQTGIPARTEVTEGSAATDSYSLVLTSRPSGNVVITVDNPDTGAITVDTSTAADIQTTLTFTQANWSTPQSVTVTPVDDADARNEMVAIKHDITSTADAHDYPTRLSIPNLTIMVTDDDTAGVTITETGTPARTEVTEGSAATDSYSLVLTSRPSGNVVITVDNPDTGAVTVDTSAIADIQTTLTFTRDNWSTPQSVTVTPVDDADARNEMVAIKHDITSTADAHDYPTRLSIPNLTIMVTDDDTAGVTITETGTPARTEVIEGSATTDSYTLVLTSRPSGNVVITVDNPDTGAVTVDTSTAADIQTTLTFTRDNWNTPQSVTVTPVDDADARDETVAIGHDITTGSGTDYPDRLSIPDLTVTVDDDEIDTDADGIANDIDLDDDNDGIADTNDLQPLIPDCGGTPTITIRTQNGTTRNPYCIDTLTELQSIASTFVNSYTAGNSVTVTNSLTRHYRLTANIDAWPTNNASTRPGMITYVDGSTATPARYNNAYTNGFDPIGGTETSTQFTGTFDGGGYTIHGLRITPTNPNIDVGLFPKIGTNGKVSDLHLRMVNIVGSGSVGALTSSVVSGVTVDGVSMSGVVRGNSNVGGLVGTNLGTVQNSYATGTVNRGTSEFLTHYVGGLVGQNTGNGIVQNSYATGTVNGGGRIDVIGGLVGYNGNTVQNSYATGAVSGGDNNDVVGGLVGQSEGFLQNSYATGAVNGGSGSDKVGGLLGELFATERSNYRNSRATITGETREDSGTARTLLQLRQLTAAQTQTDFGGHAVLRWSTNFWDFGTTSQYPALKSYETNSMGTVIEGTLLGGQR